MSHFRCIIFRTGWECRTNSKIIGASLLSKKCLLYGSGRNSYNLVLSKFCPDITCLHVILSYMNTICTNFQCKFHVIIQNKRYMIFGAQFFQFFCFLKKCIMVQLFLSKLYKSHSTFQSFLYLTVKRFSI